MLQILGLSVTIFLVGYYFLSYRPKIKMRNFAKEAQSLGYKVKLLPLQFMGYYMVRYFSQDQGTLQVLKEDWSKYDIIVGNIFTNLAIMISHSGLIKDICNQTSKFHKNPFITQVYEQLNGGGIVFTEGEVWKRKRRIISSVFHFDFLNDFIPLIEEQIEQQFQEIDLKLSQGTNEIDLKNVLTKILSNVVAKCFFGTDMKDYKIEGKPYCEYYVQFLDGVGAFIPSLEHRILRMNGYRFGLTRQSRQLKRKINLLKAIASQITVKQIQKIKNNQEPKKNILTALYENGQLNLESKQNPEQYTMHELVGQFFTFFAAGTDTTTNTLNLALHYLSEQPQHLKSLREENEAIKKLHLNKVQELKKLKFSEAVFNETLRIGCPAALIFTRLTMQQVKIGSLDLPGGVTIGISPLLVHYNREIFEDPSKFMPERWLNNRKIQPYNFIPFSGGERNCIGQYLAKIESKLFLSRLCQKYEFKALHPIKMKAKFVYSTINGTFKMNFLNKDQIR